jgi:hypothetical protein
MESLTNEEKNILELLNAIRDSIMEDSLKPIDFSLKCSVDGVWTLEMKFKEKNG